MVWSLCYRYSQHSYFFRHKRLGRYNEKLTTESASFLVRTFSIEGNILTTRPSGHLCEDDAEITKCHGCIVSTPAVYLGGSGFGFRSWDHLFWWFFSFSPGFGPMATCMGFVVRRVSLRQVFPYSHHSTNDPYSFIIRDWYSSPLSGHSAKGLCSCHSYQ
jgi:hypothetical protein